MRYSLNQYQGDIVKSPYMAQLGEYGVGRGTFGGYDPVYTGPTRGGTVQESQIQGMLLGEILNGRVPWPASGQQLYFVYLSPGVTSAFDQTNNFNGHHRLFTLLPGVYNIPVYYAVVPDTGFSSIASLTKVSSHELAEAVTDPDLGGGWYGAAGTEAEIGDGLESQAASFVANGHTYTVQKEWSNQFGRGIVADGSKSGMLDAPTNFPYYLSYFSYVGYVTVNSNGRWASGNYGWGYDGLTYYNFVTAAGDSAGWFTIQS